MLKISESHRLEMSSSDTQCNLPVRPCPIRGAAWGQTHIPQPLQSMTVFMVNNIFSFYQLQFPVFQLVPLSLWEHSGFTFATPFHEVSEQKLRPCLAFLGLNKFSSLSHPSFILCSSLSTIFAALHWTYSHLPMSVLCQGTQNWAKYSTAVLQMSKKGKPPLLSICLLYSCSFTCYKTKTDSTSSVES